MANSFDSGLLVKTLSDLSLTNLNYALAPLSAFATDFSAQIGEKGNALAVPLGQGTGGVLTNPTAFNVTTGTLGTAAVTLDHLSVPFGLTNADLQSGKRVEMLLKSATNDLAAGIKTKINALITSAYTNTAVTVAQASFVEASAKSLWASIKSGKKSLILDNVAFSQLLPSNLNSFQSNGGVTRAGFGFDGIYADTNWTSIGVANTYGFACAPEALAMASRLPELPDMLKAQYQTSLVTLENGMTVAINIWADANTRGVYCSVDVLFGAARGDLSALTVCKSA